MPAGVGVLGDVAEPRVRVPVVVAVDFELPGPGLGACETLNPRHVEIRCPEKLFHGCFLLRFVRFRVFLEMFISRRAGLAKKIYLRGVKKHFFKNSI